MFHGCGVIWIAHSSTLPQTGFQFGWCAGGTHCHERIARIRGSTGSVQQSRRGSIRRLAT